MIIVLNIALACLVAALLLALYRVLKGPSWGDRIMALDFLSATIAVLVVVVALRSGLAVLLDAALLFSILGFLSTVALTRYLLSGKVMK